MALPTWFDNLLHSGTAAGLSGIPSLQLSSNPDSDWFLRFMRVHTTTLELGKHPSRIWAPARRTAQGSGVESHLMSLGVQRVLSAREIWVVLSKNEFDAVSDEKDLGWINATEALLQERVDALMEKRGLENPIMGASLRVRLLRDGDRAMSTRSLNLLPGEFVTALLPNRPPERAASRLGVSVHIPGAWEGYRPAEPVRDGQLLYTFGSHWLDNFSHPALKEAAVYQLRRDEAGRWLHSIHPDHCERYCLKTTGNQGAMDVITLCTHAGKAILDVQLTSLEQTLDGLQPSAEAALLSANSFVDDAKKGGLLSLAECGLLLQRVHFPDVMRGYEVYLSANGSISTTPDTAAAVIQIRSDHAQLIAKGAQVTVNQDKLEPDESFELDGLVEIRVGEHLYYYKDLRGVRASGWPYLGEIRRSGWKSHMPLGGRYVIGRDLNAWVRLPDIADNKNISWADESSTASVSSRTGTFARKDFYTDSIMVASQHAAIDLSNGAILENLAKHCHVYVRRASAVVSLLPTRKSGLHQFQLRNGDELLVGNCVFQVAGEVPSGSEQTAPGIA